MARRTQQPVEVSVTREQVIAFRLQSHHLAHRLPPGSLLQAAAGCGIQNSPPGSAELSFHARVTGLKPGDLERRVAVDKTLLQVWAMRAAPYFFPTRDVPIFTTGLLPDDEESNLFFIRGASDHLNRFGLNASEMVRRTAAALPGVLEGRELTKDELGRQLAEEVGKTIQPDLLPLWNTPDGMTRYGESLVRYALALVSLHGLFCIAPRSRNAATFLLTDEWLGSALPDLDLHQAGAELVCRYLGCYGPSTPVEFAGWAGIAPAQASGLWKLVESDLVAVDFAGRLAWIHRADFSRLQMSAGGEGVRLLPPHDPYLAQPDRLTLLTDRKLHPLVWRIVGNPGVVLVDGACVAIWRSQKKGRRLQISITLLEDISPGRRSEIEAEAQTLAPFHRQCTAVEVQFPSE